MVPAIAATAGSRATVLPIIKHPTRRNKMNRMEIARLSIPAMVLLLLGFIAQTHADTEVGGTIAQSTTWGIDGSPYIVTNSVTVQGQDVILTIEAGVKVSPSCLTKGDPSGFEVAGG